MQAPFVVNPMKLYLSCMKLLELLNLSIESYELIFHCDS